MSTRKPHVGADVSAAAWIAPRLTGEFGTVTRTVPSGYPAYARICHPVDGGPGRWFTWSEVARATGRRPHPTMQWHALVGSSDPFNVRDSLWRGDSPRPGNLVPEVLHPLCDILVHHTATAQTCFFCLWDGWGWIAGSPSVNTLGSHEPIPPAFSARELNAPRVHHPGRDYLLLSGPLPAALRLGPDRFEPQSPNIFWPADRAWCVASEIDFDSTLVGGSTALVNAILEARALDAWPVNPDDSLAVDADHINPVR
jgi:hypothetical protein